MTKNKIREENLITSMDLNWKVKAFSPFLTTFKVIFTSDPRKVLTNANDGIWFGAAIFIAVTLSILTSLGLIYVPYLPPFSSFYSNLTPFINPEYDFIVLAGMVVPPLALVVIAYWICFATGHTAAKHLKPDARQGAQRIAMYLTAVLLIFSAFACMVVVLFLIGIGWFVRENFGYWIPMHSITIYVMCALAIGLLIHAWRLFIQVGVKFKNRWYTGLYIVAIVTLIAFNSGFAASVIENHIERASQARNKEMTVVRNGPIKGEVLYCESSQDLLNCSIVLYPKKWQNIELIGPWSLGYMKPGGVPNLKMRWRLMTAENNVIPKIMLEPKKNISVEVSSPQNAICKRGGASIDNGDAIFFVRGRVDDETSNSIKDFRVFITNKTGEFSQMVSAVCKT